MSKENRVSDELAACPFCGGDAELRVDAETASFDLGCSTDGCAAMTWAGEDKQYLDDAISAWNLRSKPVAGVEVKDALEFYRVEAEAAAKAVPAKQTDAMAAIVTVMSLDGGRRAREAIATLSTLSLPAHEPVEEEGSRQAAVDIADAVMKWMVKYDLLDPEHEYFDHDIIEVLNDLAPAEEARILYRHQKRGTVYELIGIGKMQAEGWIDDARSRGGNLQDGPHVVGYRETHPVDMREVAIYRSFTDPTEIWVRPREEFEDGRFEALTAALKEA